MPGGFTATIKGIMHRAQIEEKRFLWVVAAYLLLAFIFAPIVATAGLAELIWRKSHSRVFVLLATAVIIYALIRLF